MRVRRQHYCICLTTYCTEQYAMLRRVYAQETDNPQAAQCASCSVDVVALAVAAHVLPHLLHDISIDVLAHTMHPFMANVALHTRFVHIVRPRAAYQSALGSRARCRSARVATGR
jgi:hypothetical protein